MAHDFDQFPLYDPIIKSGNKLSDLWVSVMSSFFQNLTSYLNSTGVFLPQLTTAERDALATSQTPAINGQMIYNTTLNSAQYFKNGVWTSF